MILRQRTYVSHACLHRLRLLLRFLVLHHNVCVSRACLHLLRRLLCFRRIALQCMRFTRVSESVKTTVAFSFIWRNNIYVSHACLHRLRRLLRFPLYGIYNIYVSHACLNQLRPLLRFSSYGVTIHTFHSRVCSDGFGVFLRIALQCMRFKCVSSSVKTAFAFSVV